MEEEKGGRRGLEEKDGNQKEEEQEEGVGRRSWKK